MAKSGGTWKKGESGNPKGRPKDAGLEEARELIANSGLLKFAIQRAKESDTVLVALLKKAYPDLSSTELKSAAEGFKLIVEQGGFNAVYQKKTELIDKDIT